MLQQSVDLFADGLYVMLFLFNWFHLVTMIYFVMIMERDKGLSTIAFLACSSQSLSNKILWWALFKINRIWHLGWSRLFRLFRQFRVCEFLVHLITILSSISFRLLIKEEKMMFRCIVQFHIFFLNYIVLAQICKLCIAPIEKSSPQDVYILTLEDSI